MPIEPCSKDGKSGGFRWGQHGACYFGPDAKQKAVKQALTFTPSDKVHKMLQHDKAALKYFGDRESVNIAKAILNEEYKTGASNKFLHSIASFLSSKSDDGQMSSSTNRSGMLDDKNDKGEDDDCAMAADYVDNAGDLSGNPSKTGDGSDNEFNKPAKSAVEGKDPNRGPVGTDDYGKDTSEDIPDGDEKDKQIKAFVEGKDPNRQPVIEDNYKSGDECKVTPVKSGVSDGKPAKTTVDTEDPDNNKNGLDKSNEQLAGNVVKPPYNKSASPETPPGKNFHAYAPPSRTEETPPTTDNRTTLDPKLQFKVKSDKDCNFGMDESDGPNSKPKASGGSISEVPEKEDIVKKTTKGKDSSEEDEMDSAKCEQIWSTIAYISQEERDKVSSEDFAGPHRSYPIRNAEDVKNAAHLVGHAANPSAVKRKIIEIAKRKDLHHALPDSWRNPDEQSIANINNIANYFGFTAGELALIIDNKCWAYISSKERDKMPNSEFAGSPGSKEFPVPDQKHYELAWRLVGRKPKGEQAAIRKRLAEIGLKRGWHVPDSYKSEADMDFQENAVNKPSPSTKEDEQVN